MRILFASSEVFPLVKTGGLADVSGALPAALMTAGEDVKILLPGYPQVLEKAENQTPIADLGDPLWVGGHTMLVSATLPGSGVPLWILDCPALYARSGGPYQDDSGREHSDNHLRFGMLSWAAAHLCTGGNPTDWRPDILHCNDWQTGLAPAYLHAWDVGDRPRMVFTIHNIAYQGQFGADVLWRLGLPGSMYSMHGVEYYGGISFLKGGLRYADKITTVSPRYAKEIQTPEFGCGIEGLLHARASDLVGILNGADYGVWNPAIDPYIAHSFGPENLAEGKAANKAALQRELGLDVNPDVPLLVVISRLSYQKGLDMVLHSLPHLRHRGAQLALLGTGDRDLESGFRAAAGSDPAGIAVTIGYSEALAHRLIASGDVLLMPSRFEPCGLTQFYAFHYGTLPLVHMTGGLADTVVDTAYDTSMNNTATGFVFDHPNSGSFQACSDRMFEAWQDRPLWQQVQNTAIAQDFSWNRAVRPYITLYQQMLA